MTTLLNSHQAAELLDLDVQTVRRLARTGKIPAWRIGRGGQFRFHADELVPRHDLKPSAPARGDYDRGRLD